MMKKYDSYKPSGVEFIGDIPEHWEVRKLKYCMKDKITDGPHETPKFISDGVPFLSVDGIQNGELVFENCRKISEKAHKEYSKKALVEYDDILLGKAASIGKIARVKVDFEFSIWSPLALIKANKQIISPIFLEYALKTKMVQYQIETLATNNTQKNISMADIPRFILTIPPLKEQEKIANFLDTKNQQIEEFIKEKQHQIELLEEQKEAIINQAITKGLDDSVEFKDSGIEWIGDIPKHWEVRKLKFLADIMGSNVDKLTKENEIPVLLCNYTDVYKNDVITNKINFMEATATKLEIDKFLIQKDDVIITKDSETADDMAMPTYVKENFENVLCGYHLSLIRTYGKVKGKFLYYLFTAKNFNIRFELHSNGVTRFGLGAGIIKNTFIAYPTHQEQKNIIKYIEIEIFKINEVINQIQKEIDLIKEYKISLISEVVTGQIKIAKKKKKKEEANIQFKRAVLGAYIIDKSLDEKTFGHVKFQKLLYMCEAVNNLDFESNYKRHAMGPHDPKLLKSIESMIKKSRWFEAKKEHKRYVYYRLEKANDYKKYIDRYWDTQKIDNLLKFFKSMNTEQSEIVATLYSAWSDLLTKSKAVSDSEIIDEVLNNWHENKKKISYDRWEKALYWMREKQLVPKV